jgi:macrolide transport system ATP-binding/permease protein
MLGISIGIAAVVSIVSLGHTVETQLQQSARKASSGKLGISLGNRNLPRGAVAQPFTMRDVAALRSLSGVTAVVPRYSSQATARHGRRDDTVTVTGIADQSIVRNAQTIIQGRDISARDLEARAQVVILDRVARANLFPSGEQALGQQVMIGALPFSVIGLSSNFNATALLSAPVQGNVYIPHTTYSSKLDTRGEINSMTVHFSPLIPEESFRAQVRRRLLALHGGIEDFSLDDYGTTLADLATMLKSVTGVLGGIAAIALLVGGVGVMNIMLVSVAERTREIGIRMAVGARQRDVQRQFLIESVLLCCIGGVAGLGMSWLGMLATMWAWPYVQLSISESSVALALGTCTAIGLLFGNMPARNAAALRPVVALARQ